MSSGTACDEAEVVEVTHDEANDMFDRVAQKEMGIPGVEFLRRWDAGDYENVDYDAVPGLVEVWMYLPFVR